MCVDACTVGVSECTPAGPRACVDESGCGAWSKAVACTPGRVCDAGGCVPKPIPCSGVPGDFHSQPLDSGGESRFYYLHVPVDYTCGAAWPLLVDFHGTGFGGETDPVEESWAFDEMKAVADAEHFIVVRPRSRSKAFNGQYVFQWDINPGDLDANHELAVALVADLETRYYIDAARVYALGFSNGPTMAAQFLADDPSIMHGYAAISGGLNAPLGGGPMLDGPAAPRVYEMTGFRDYMMVAQRNLDAHLSSHGLAADHVFVRQADTGHELYGWHYREAFKWMDHAERPAKGTLAVGWALDPTFHGPESLIQASLDPSGAIHVAGTGGAIYRRQAQATTWTETATLSSNGVSVPLSDLCFSPSGMGFAAGDGWLASSADGSAWSVRPRVPELGGMQFGYTHVTSVGCGASRLVAAGVWDVGATDDGAATWSPIALDTAPPFFTQIRQLPSGTWLGIGYYDALVRSTDGASFTTINPPAQTQWLNAIAAAPGGKAWVVGEKGTIFASTDDASSFVVQQAPGVEDLYAVAFATDGLRGFAVGAHGAVYATVDGGSVWSDRSTGLDAFLGDVIVLDDHTAMVVGGEGTILTTSF